MPPRLETTLKLSLTVALRTTSSDSFAPNRLRPDVPGYDPRDLLKLYMYGYLWQIRKRPKLHRLAKCPRIS